MPVRRCYHCAELKAIFPEVLATLFCCQVALQDDDEEEEPYALRPCVLCFHHLQEITHRVVVPELAFTGDTTAEFITDPANAEVFKARLLIMECSFLDDAMPPENAKVPCTSNNTN